MPARVTLLLLLLILASFARAEEIWTGTSDVKFRGYSTLHDFKGSVNQVPLKVAVADGPNGRVVRAISSVDVQGMSTAHEQRDKNMWTMFQRAKCRFIKVEVNGAEERQLRPVDGQPGRMPVLVTVAGVIFSVNAAVTNVVESPARCSFDLAFPVPLKVFNLDPPKTLGGLVKVRDIVDVTARVELKKTSAK